MAKPTAVELGCGYALVTTAANDMLLRNKAPVPGKDERKT